MLGKKKNRSKNSGAYTSGILFGLFVLVLSYFTYMHNYTNPPHLFWDENYHIASAQKYLNGIFFMEPHPPFGKLVIAAGEALVDANTNDDDFIGTDYGKTLPSGFSFAGYRLFPALFGWLTAIVLYGIFLLISKKPVFAVFLTFPYIFDNAQIVHSRGAMLDSTMVFLAAVLILLFLLLFQWRERPKLFAVLSLVFGVAFALLLTTKVLGLIMILLIPALFVRLYPHWRRAGVFLLYGSIGFLITYVAVWQVHFSLARTVQPSLPDNGYYQASEEYKQILDSGKTALPSTFFVQWRDSVKFLSHYSKGVPELDLCKTVENGSPWFLWPIGARTISYRWSAAQNATYRYLYLVPNSAGWWLALGSVFLATGFLAASVLLPLKKKLQNPFLLLTFLGLYISYMVAISHLTRVMYLYHYFLPLLFSYVLIGLVFCEIAPSAKKGVAEYWKTAGLLVVGMLIFVAYQAMSPLTYYTPIGKEAFQKRSLIRLWDMNCVGCDRNSPLVKPRGNER